MIDDVLQNGYEKSQGFASSSPSLRKTKDCLLAMAKGCQERAFSYTSIPFKVSLIVMLCT